MRVLARALGVLATIVLAPVQVGAQGVPIQPGIAPIAPASPPGSGLSGSGSALTERLLQRYRAGEYEWVVAIGPGAVRDDPDNVELKLAVANSLAWTGRYTQAIAQYRSLAGTKAAAQGEIGIAYIDLWRQRPWTALPVLERVAAADPASRDAAEALGRARDQLRQRTTLRLGSARDSEGVRRNGAAVGHVWWDAAAGTRLEFSAQADRERVSPLSLPYREIGFSVFRPRALLAPKLDLAAEVDPCSSGYGTLQVEPIADVLQVRAGRSNWGRQVFNPRALRDCLYSARFGIAGAPDVGFGRVVYQADFNRVSDGNRLIDASLRVEPEALRLGGGFRIDFGAAARHASRNEPRYWSPADGHGVAFVGLSYSRWGEKAGMYVRLQPGTAIWGEAKGFNWGASGGGKWLVSRDWAIGLDAWTGSNPRPGKYRASLVTLSLEYAW